MRMRTRATILAAALAAAAVAGGAPAQPPGGGAPSPAAPAARSGQMSAFYSACLASGGIPGVFAEGRRETVVLFAAEGEARLVSIAIAPDAPEAARIELTAYGGGTTLPYVALAAGGSAAFALTTLRAQPSGRRAEYCMRVR